ncbi:MAG TPA: hypothetical protein VKM55_16775 [Candidatus Lokiarchaeia archaeon]|nr:hypothetical protein [Candidatus Lokiarchaeia archaeon]
MAGKKHPGKISYYELDNGEEKLVSVDDVQNVPESMRFRKDVSGTDVPVVKTVAIKDAKGNIREIIEYGPKGEFLQSTMAMPPLPRPVSSKPPVPKPTKSKPSK